MPFVYHDWSVEVALAHEECGKKKHTGSLIVAVAQAVHAAGMLLADLHKDKSRLAVEPGTIIARLPAPQARAGLRSTR